MAARIFDRREAKALAAFNEGRVSVSRYARVFPVTGSKGDLYTVVLYEDGRGLDEFGTVCNCPAGKEERPCYHVAAAKRYASVLDGGS